MSRKYAQSDYRQEENENVGQNSQIPKPSLFWFPVYEGVFEHAAIIRDAVWFFMWLIARTTREEDGRGAVLGGIPIPDERPARDLGVQVKTIRRWRRMLREGDYVEVERAPHGYRYTVLKSKKWQNPSKGDRPKLPTIRRVIARNGQSQCPKRAITAILSLMTIQQATQQKKQQKKKNLLLLPLQQKNPEPRDTRKHGRQSI